MNNETLNGFYNEEELIELCQKGKITMVEYVEHRSTEMTNEYQDFCYLEGLSPKEETSAVKFLEHIESML